ncbi:MAG: branched-chain amino acid ABC transporter permease [Alphaproteobacteria bacterium]|jgi:branched-chain amino acid transport system permease protein|nr:branched-chain amino acid ABC transporter permease [Alphaproteobacteria bacterium]
MDQFFGILNYLMFLITMAGIYGVMTLGLNLQWGLTGLFNVGIAGFFAIGAYVSAIVTTAETSKHLGGYDLPFGAGLVVAMICSGLVAWGIGRICIRLRSDYLAIATIGIAEILRLILKNEAWATNGSRGISNIPKPLETLPEPWGPVAYMLLVFAILMAAYWLLERGQDAPWGRVMKAIRDNELAARAAGKNIERFRIEAFIIGSALMGLGGALMAHFFKFVGPEATDPLMTTFLVWVMLVVGGSGNNRGAILGAVVIWTLWSATEIVTSRFSGEWAVRIPFMRMFLIGLVLQVVLQKFSQGLLPEKLPEGRAGQKPAPADD